MGAGEDFNPGFSFDFGSGAQEGPAQAPWEFGGERVTVEGCSNTQLLCW